MLAWRSVIKAGVGWGHMRSESGACAFLLGLRVVEGRRMFGGREERGLLPLHITERKEISPCILQRV